MTVARVRMLAILAGGAAGALARAGDGEALSQERGAWPWATFWVNLAGAALLAWLTTRLTEMVAPTRYRRSLLGTGFCGALTTFRRSRSRRSGSPTTAMRRWRSPTRPRA